MGRSLSTLLATVLISLGAVAEESEIRRIANEVAPRYRLDPKLVLAIIKVESNFNPKAIGKTHGEVGLMQLRPRFHTCASFEERVNIECGVRYLKIIQRKFKHTYGDAWFVAYNTGPSIRLSFPKKSAYYRKVIYAINR